MAKPTSRSTRAIFAVLAILLAVGFFFRRGALRHSPPAPVAPVAPVTPVNSAKLEPPPPAPKAAPAKVAPAPEAPWEPAGSTTVEGEAMTIHKRGDERMLRRADGSPFETYIEINGKREGPSSRWYQSGNVYSVGDWRAGLKQGDWTFFQDDGSVSQKGAFAQGMREGEWESFYPNGTLRWRGSYEHDRQVGTWAFVKSTGEVDTVQSGVYQDGRRVGN
jgi:hypothetical protein